MSKRPDDCGDMAEVRAEIDRIDTALVDLIAERFSYVDRAWQLKSNPDEATVPWRIQEVIDKVEARARERGLPPELAEALWRQMIGWFIQYEEQRLSQGRGDGLMAGLQAGETANGTPQDLAGSSGAYAHGKRRGVRLLRAGGNGARRMGGGLSLAWRSAHR